MAPDDADKRDYNVIFKKAEEKIQFVIEFDLGRHKVKTKIH